MEDCIICVCVLSLIEVLIDQWVIKTELYIFELLNTFIIRYTLMILTSRGPCIAIYSYNKSQKDALFLSFILVKNTTCFGQTYCPSSGVLILYS